MGWEDSPIVSFSRDGETFTLGRGPEDTVLHLYGSQGLGLPPVTLAKSDRLAGDGSIVRGVRYGDREVYVPLLIDAGSMAECDAIRRSLYALLAPDLGPVEVRVQGTDTDRYISGYLTGGLEGDFGDGYHGAWQTLGLTFDCVDPWWMGAQHLEELQVAPGSKPFISDTVPFFPVVLAGSTVQGVFMVDVSGDAPVRPVWQVTGPGTDLTIRDGANKLAVSGSFAAGEVVTFDARTGTITPDRWDDVTLDSDLFLLSPGQHRITVTMVGATPDSMVRLVYRERHRWAI